MSNRLYLRNFNLATGIIKLKSNQLLFLGLQQISSNPHSKRQKDLDISETKTHFVASFLSPLIKERNKLFNTIKILQAFNLFKTADFQIYLKLLLQMRTFKAKLCFVRD